MIHKNSVLIIAAAIAVAASTTPAAELHVGPGQTHTTIQSAIDAAVNGDTVIIADGTWTPAAGFLTIEAKSITLRSANGPEHCILLKTRLNLNNLTEGEIRIEGLAFRRKNVSISADHVNRLILDNCVMEQTIRALYAEHSTCELYHCRIRRTGVYYTGSGWVVAQDKTPAVLIDWSPGVAILDDCTISEVYGYGIYIEAPDAVLRNCIVSACSQRAIVAPNPCRLVNCTVVNNHSGLATKNDSAVIENCIFWDNVRDITPFYSASDLDRPESITVRNSYLMHGWPGENVYRNDPEITREGFLRMDSACINAGIVVDNSATDVDGETRIQDGVIDIGADEYSDQDNDGLPDRWEARHFDSPSAALPDQDDDADDLTNIEEYVRSSYPRSTYWYVDAAQPDDSGDGRTWQTAKKTIAAATLSAAAGDIVLVADGQYNESHVFWGQPVWIKSANGPEHCTLLPATLWLHYFEGAEFILDGFTIRRTNPNLSVVSIDKHGTPTIQNCIISGGMHGIEIKSGGATVRNCRINGNTEDGISMPGDDSYYIRPLRVENCHIHNNGGHGILACDRRTTFPLVTIYDCNIHHNGGAGVWSWAIFDVARCRFEGNGLCGFGVTSPDMVIRDCVVTGNSWYGRHLPGLGVSSHGDYPIQRLLIENCTVAHNEGSGGIGGYAQNGGQHEVFVTNSIVWDNELGNSPTGQIYVQPNVSYVVKNTNVEGGWEGPGNIDQEPFFADPGCTQQQLTPGGWYEFFWVSGDYHLLSFSPCINAADPNYVADENDTDAEGKPRVLHGRLDMGAYEKASADFVGDLQIGVSDLMFFASRWLQEGCEEPNWCDSADLTLDGIVDKSDLGQFAGEWALNTLGPLAWWRLDESSGNFASDSSLFSRVGTLVNADDTAWVQGRTGNALVLDGVDDYLLIRYYPGVVGEQSRTVAAWIKTIDTSGQIIAWGWSTAAPGSRWNLVTESQGRLCLEVGDGEIVGSTTICDDRWHHVAAVLDSDGTPNVNEVKLYVDGIIETPSSASDRIIDTDAYEVRIGVWVPWSEDPRFFKGLMDDVRIYGRPLSAEEIAALAL